MKQSVFISYPSADKTQADLVCWAIERAGLLCWIAPRDIQPGSDWIESIWTAIRMSRALVVVFTENANTSVHIPREVSLAVSHDVAVIPFKLSPRPALGALEYLLCTTHWLDATQPPLERHIGALVARLQVVVTSSDSVQTRRNPAAPTGPMLWQEVRSRLADSKFDVQADVDFEGWTFPVFASRREPWSLGAISSGIALADLGNLSAKKLTAFCVACADLAGEHYVRSASLIRRATTGGLVFAAMAVAPRLDAVASRALREARSINAKPSGIFAPTVCFPAVYDTSLGVLHFGGVGLNRWDPLTRNLTRLLRNCITKEDLKCG